MERSPWLEGSMLQPGQDTNRPVSRTMVGMPAGSKPISCACDKRPGPCRPYMHDPVFGADRSPGQGGAQGLSGPSKNALKNASKNAFGWASHLVPWPCARPRLYSAFWLFFFWPLLPEGPHAVPGPSAWSSFRLSACSMPEEHAAGALVQLLVSENPALTDTLPCS